MFQYPLEFGWCISLATLKAILCILPKRECALRLAQFPPVLFIVSVSIFWMHVAIALAVSKA